MAGPENEYGKTSTAGAPEALAVDSEVTAAHEEYERRPVPGKALLGFKSFLGMYAGEHTAGTELMIGPLFVAAGVSAFDFIAGLLVGNALAVLSWMLFCAPIATRARLTLYCQLEQICGRKLVTVYNLANGVMFTILAGAMITVSATALGVWFKFDMPGLNATAPTSVGWVAAVAVVGVLFSLSAAYGFKAISKLANIAAPWMILVFLAFGVITLRRFMDATQTEIGSASDLWTLCKTVIWKGGEPLAGRVKFTFWHVMFFAWFCNMAWHIGLSDLTVFRYAKKSWYALASAAGMYIGHFMAWICASLLFAYRLHLDPANTDVHPGPMTYETAGLAGLFCVIIAGWTTASPTMYRAGLAFQAIVPKVSRFKVTLGLGLFSILAAAAYPVFTMRLLDFVAIWGLILMPMGAVIFVDFWLIKKFGLQSNYAMRSGKSFNWAAGLAWLVTLTVCTILVNMSAIVESLVERGILYDSAGLDWVKSHLTIEIYFVSLPGWFLTAAVYLLVSYVYQKKVRPQAVKG
jgi:purine-cytosine permease-like protein